jgi:hypothetical protein
MDYYVLWAVTDFMLIQRPLRILDPTCVGRILGVEDCIEDYRWADMKFICFNNGTDG